MSPLTGLDAWLHLFHVRGLGPVGFDALLQAFGTAEAICAAPQRQLATVVPPRLATAIAGDDSRTARQAVADWLAAGPARSLLTRHDADYPPALAQSPAAGMPARRGAAMPAALPGRWLTPAIPSSAAWPPVSTRRPMTAQSTPRRPPSP